MTPDLSYYWEAARQQYEDDKWAEGKKKAYNAVVRFVAKIQVCTYFIKLL